MSLDLYLDSQVELISKFTSNVIQRLRLSDSLNCCPQCGFIDAIQSVFSSHFVKNQAHLHTVTSCITNLLVVSDYYETVSNTTFYDILADLPHSYADHSNFLSYAKIKKAKAQGQEVGHSSEGWKLDRFKFLPMVERAWAVNPYAEWYVFIKADAYIFWDTMFRLLHQLDASEPYYLGKPVEGSYGRWFAYGGAGFVLSRGLMEKFLDKGVTTWKGEVAHVKPSVQFEKWVKSDCCGDAVLAYALLKRTGIKLSAMYPTFSGDEERYLKVDEENLCVPLASLHHVGPELMRKLWKWERLRGTDETLITHSTLLQYTHSFLTSATQNRTSWDNNADLALPDNSQAHSSPEACASACYADPECLQYSHFKKTCRKADFVKLGHAAEDEGGWVSGWDLEKMQKLGFRNDGGASNACGNVTWPNGVLR